MSELIQKNDNRATIRWKLLTGASALALTVCAFADDAAKAEDADRPLVWIELGGQAEHITGQGSPFAPHFLAENPDSSILWSGRNPIEAQRPPFLDYGERAKLSFEPEDSNWIVSVSAQFGRSNTSRETDHQTNNVFYTVYKSGVPYNNNNPRGINNFADTKPHHSDKHVIIDFQAGKDVGLGLLGLNGSSVLSAGVRFAQFVSHSSVDMRARPDLEFKYPSIIQRFFPSRVAKWPYFHTYHASGSASRQFHGVGPSISWNASVPLAGNAQDGEIVLDWGVNGAILFGRQRARVQHHGSGEYVKTLFVRTGNYFNTPSPTVGGHNSDRSVTVPNVGGFAGLSYRYTDAKISIGYRYDTFLSAMDTGIDAVKKSNLTFNGPYASISVGLGD